MGPLIKIKKFLNNNRDTFKEKEIKESLNSYSNEEEVKIFFDKYLNFKKNLNKLRGKSLFELSEENMKELSLNLGQRKKLIKYINTFKKINDEENKMILNKNSSIEEVAKYLKEILNFCEDSIKVLDCDGEYLFSLEKKDIEELNLKEGEKEKLKEYLEMNNSYNKLQNKFDFNENEKYDISKKGETSKNLENESEKKEKIKESLNKIKKQSQNKNFYSLSNYKIKSINIDSKYNIFFPLIIQEKFLNNGKLSIYKNNFFNGLFTNYDFLFINEIKINDAQKENFRIILVQVPIREEVRDLSICLLINYNLENNCYIKIKKTYSNYFYVDNLG